MYESDLLISSVVSLMFAVCWGGCRKLELDGREVWSGERQVLEPSGYVSEPQRGRQAQRSARRIHGSAA